MCKVLKVSRSGFYTWNERPESARSKQHRALLEKIRTINADRNKDNYGSPRVHQELVAQGDVICENTIAQLMRNHGIASKSKRKFRVTTDSKNTHSPAENVLARQFVQEFPNRVWVADITYIWTKAGWLYLAAVLDTYSRKIVGWSMSTGLHSQLVMDAMGMALGRRLPDSDSSLIHHSDRGSQYASDLYRELLKEHNITCSMSRKANCWDNAMMESFFATLKTENVYRKQFATRAAARQSIFEYIEMFYNTERRHSALGYMSPDEYERTNVTKN
jgi:putative transposase